jgi:hypothetical protein
MQSPSQLLCPLIIYRLNLSMTGPTTTQPSVVDTKPFNNISVSFGISVVQNRGSSGIRCFSPLTRYHYSQFCISIDTNSFCAYWKFVMVISCWRHNDVHLATAQCGKQWKVHIVSIMKIQLWGKGPLCYVNCSIYTTNTHICSSKLWNSY